MGTAKTKSAEKTAAVVGFDPLSINRRLYNQVSELLRQLEEDKNVSLKERYMALITIGRIQTIFVALRKEKIDEPARGATVRKYAAAFKAHDASRRAQLARSAAAADSAAEPDPGIGDIWGDDESDDIA